MEIPKKSALGKALDFVARARHAEDRTRYAIQYILRDGDYIVATDGKRLHAARIADLPGAEHVPAGLFDLLSKGKSFVFLPPSDPGAIFPKWREVIPNGPENEKISFMEIGKFNRGLAVSSRVIGVFEMGGIRINADYLSDLPDGRWDFNHNGTSSPVMFSRGGADSVKWDEIAVIMPFTAEKR